MENGLLKGGVGTIIAEFANENNYHRAKIKRMGIMDKFIPHGTVEQLHRNRQDRRNISCRKYKRVANAIANEKYYTSDTRFPWHSMPNL